MTRPGPSALPPSAPSAFVAPPAQSAVPSAGKSSVRTRRDLCPGTFRPWVADDGLLVRLRVPGGQLPAAQLTALSSVAQRHGDGQVHLTSRANLQVRGLPSRDGALPHQVVADLEATGLMPSRSHELVRNILASPLTGLAPGGHTDLRGLTRALDEALRAEPEAADLAGRFLFVLDDGRGDLVARSCDLGLVALDAEHVQVRIGDRFGPVVARVLAPETLVRLARTFARQRGSGPDAPWHVAEFEAAGGTLDHHLARPQAPDARVPEPAAPLPHGRLNGGASQIEHVRVPDHGLGPPEVAALTARASHLVLTPWRGVLVPARPSHQEIS